MRKLVVFTSLKNGEFVSFQHERTNIFVIFSYRKILLIEKINIFIGDQEIILIEEHRFEVGMLPSNFFIKAGFAFLPRNFCEKIGVSYEEAVVI